MPVLHEGDRRAGRGFRLRDDGIAKGVQKLGYVSEQIGDHLTIGPLELTRQGGGCIAQLRVRLGYLVSTHPGQGAITLRYA